MADSGKIIVVANEKGGAGKTQAACQLAGTLGRRGYEVLLADCDGQGSSTLWSGMNEGENFRAQCWKGAQYKEKIVSQLEQLVPKYDVIVVDCGAGADVKSTWGALLVADLVVVPTKLYAADVGALPGIKRMVRNAWEDSGRRYPALVLPMAVRLHMKDDQSTLKNTLSRDPEFPLAKTVFSERRAFPRSMLLGGTVHDVAGSQDSVREVEAFVDEVCGLVKLAPSTQQRVAA
jgi:chromosome partitioning protein